MSCILQLMWQRHRTRTHRGLQRFLELKKAGRKSRLAERQNHPKEPKIKTLEAGHFKFSLLTCLKMVQICANAVSIIGASYLQFPKTSTFLTCSSYATAVFYTLKLLQLEIGFQIIRFLRSPPNTNVPWNVWRPTATESIWEA